MALTSHLRRQGGDWAHGSEVAFLTYRIVGMLTETLVPALPAGIAAQCESGKLGVQAQIREA